MVENTVRHGVHLLFRGGRVSSLQEHAAHIGNNWIWLILLACPLIHVFMHGSHGGHGDHKDKDKED